MYRGHGKLIIKLLWDEELEIFFFLYNTAITITVLLYVP